jgi:hypothetical protein
VVAGLVASPQRARAGAAAQARRVRTVPFPGPT